jgi:hypothetical protein
MFSMLVRFDGYYGVHAEELNTEFNLLERIRIKVQKSALRTRVLRRVIQNLHDDGFNELARRTRAICEIQEDYCLPS